ncbi:MAG: TetR/AcrR family transcriptional regulator, partial [Pseudomonadota bacterium]
MSQGAKPAVQARSRETRDQLMKALEALLRQKEFDEIGVAEIAAAAGVSPASVYRRYDKKDGFIPALFEFYHERLLDWSASPAAQDASALKTRA